MRRFDVDAKDAGEFIKGVMMASAIMNRDAGYVAASTGIRKVAVATLKSWQT